MDLFWKRLSVCCAAAGAALLARSEYERGHLVTRACTVTLPDYAEGLDGLVIVFLSDLHDNVLGPGNTDLIDAVRQAAPDLILIGGDMPTVKPWRKKDFSTLDELFEKLSGIAGIYCALGNHEQRMKEKRYEGWWEEYSRLLEKKGITVLDNSSVRLYRGGTALRLTGLSLGEDCYRKGRKKKIGRADIERLVKPGEDNDFELLLAHNPIYLDAYAAWGADLVLSGHLHGGTIRIPGLGGLMTPQFQFFSPYTRGQLKKGKTNMVVSAGLGTHSINVRLNNRPEAVVIRLKAEN